MDTDGIFSPWNVPAQDNKATNDNAWMRNQGSSAATPAAGAIDQPGAYADAGDAGPSTAVPGTGYVPYDQYYLPPTYTSAYQTTPWQNQPTAYSTINHALGATHPPATQNTSNSTSMVIDPSLTTSNGNDIQQQPQYSGYFGQAPAPAPTPPTPQQLQLQYQRHQVQQPQTTQQQQQRPPSSQGYPYSGYSTSVYQPFYQHNAQSPQPPTVSPQSLQTPSPFVPVAPQQFYSTNPVSATASSSSGTSGTPTSQPPATPAGPTPEEKRSRFLAALRPLLTDTSFTGAQAVNSLMNRIHEYGVDDVDGPTRKTILNAIRDHAGNHYFRAWSENPEAIDLARDWLKQGYQAKDETVMPLLHLVDRLPFTMTSLASSKIGKVVKKLAKEGASPAIRDMAHNLERRWRAMLDKDKSEAKPGEKRKPTEPPPAKPAPSKKQALAPPATKAAAVKREGAVVAAKGAKVDTGFFSAPKAKPKLPSFKKSPAAAPAEAKREADAGVAQPSSYDPFKDALMSMKKRDSPAASAGVGAGTASQPTAAPAKGGKKKKSVTWAPEGKLESVRLIDKAVYDDDESGPHPQHHDLRDFDRGEGAALKHLFEEVVDWFEPVLIEIKDDERYDRGRESIEKEKQEQREATALAALYPDPSLIPPCPAEPATVLSAEETDANVVRMSPGADIAAEVGGDDFAPPPSMGSVAELVGQLAAGNAAAVDPAMSAVQFNAPAGLDLQAAGMSGADQNLGALRDASQETLQHLLSQLQNTMAAQAPPAPPGGFPQWGGAGGGPEAAPANGFGEYGQWGHNGHAEGGGFGRGRGRGRGRGGGGGGGDHRPCRYGDQCDFLHEIP
ncbi:hypothetical protein HDZ31DRAFT_31177 [Schizophyllum fasciatum]